MAAQEGGGVIAPGGARELCRCGTEGRGLMSMVGGLAKWMQEPAP